MFARFLHCEVTYPSLSASPPHPPPQSTTTVCHTSLEPSLSLSPAHTLERGGKNEAVPPAVGGGGEVSL